MGGRESESSSTLGCQKENSEKTGASGRLERGSSLRQNLGAPNVPFYPCKAGQDLRRRASRLCQIGNCKREGYERYRKETHLRVGKMTCTKREQRRRVYVWSVLESVLVWANQKKTRVITPREKDAKGDGTEGFENANRTSSEVKRENNESRPPNNIKENASQQ